MASAKIQPTAGQPRASRRQSAVSPGAGIGVDSRGGAVVDPTANVIALNEASDRRQDDLRSYFEKYVDVQLEHLHEMATLRAEHAKALEGNAKALSEAESKRIDAIRAVDVAAVKTEAERASLAIQTLATQASVKEETLRASLNAATQAVAKQTSDIVGQLIERIAALEKSSYEGKGKEAVSDPMLGRMVEELRALRSEMSTSKGKEAVTDPIMNQLVLQMQTLTNAVTSSKGEKAGIDKTWATIMALGAGGGGAALMALLGK